MPDALEIISTKDLKSMGFRVKKKCHTHTHTTGNLATAHLKKRQNHVYPYIPKSSTIQAHSQCLIVI